MNKDQLPQEIVQMLSGSEEDRARLLRMITDEMARRLRITGRLLQCIDAVIEDDAIPDDTSKLAGIKVVMDKIKEEAPY